MTTLPTTSPEHHADAPAAALSQEERAGAAQVARRLAVELRAVVALLPPEDRTASTMSRLLQVDRNTCQRLVASLAADEPNEAMLVRLPGVQGLRQMLDAVARRQRDPASLEQLAAATAAIDAFQVLIDRVAGSQRRLRHRLEADIGFGGDSRAPSDDANARRALFRAAAEVVGRWSDVMIVMSFIRPLPQDPTLTETVRIQGRIGHMWRASAVPLEITAATPDSLALNAAAGASGHDSASMRTLADRPDRGDTPDSLLTSYCSRPLPRVTSRTSGTQTIHVIDPAEPAHAHPIDIVLGHRRATPDRHPATQDPPIGELSSLVVYPARRLISDVYLHRDIARSCVPSAELHLGGFLTGTTGRRARWSTRFNGDPRLQQLGAGLKHAATPAYARHAELTGEVFQRVGWDPDQFLGFRCDVLYPIWQAAYCMLFDFGASVPPTADLSSR